MTFNSVKKPRLRLRPMKDVCLSSMVLFVGCATVEAPTTSPINHAPLGVVKATAIEVCRPAGEQAYLSRLVCSDGKSPVFRRIGSFRPRTHFPSTLSSEQVNRLIEKRHAPLKPGETDHHTVDRYELLCGETRYLVYMDMYHCDGPPTQALPPGFDDKARPQLDRSAPTPR